MMTACVQMATVGEPWRGWSRGETPWQMVVESGDKRYACYGAEPYADASKTIEDHERRGNRDEPQTG